MNRLDYFLEGRLFEWVMTISMLLLAVQIGIWPRTVDFSAFQDLNRVMSDKFVGLFMGFVGMARAISLILNGHRIQGLRIGPIVRAVIAIFCAFMWTQFAFALFQFSITSGRPSPGLPFWTMFIFAELYVAYRTMRNAR